jgi:hypothetical protein
MEVDRVANVVVGAFDAEAIAGLALFAIVIVVLVRALVAEHQRGAHRSHRRADR